MHQALVFSYLTGLALAQLPHGLYLAADEIVTFPLLLRACEIVCRPLLIKHRPYLPLKYFVKLIYYQHRFILSLRT